MIIVTMGTVPYDTPASHSGAYLTIKSFTPAASAVPVCYEHWLLSDFTCRHPAVFGPAEKGFMILHQLDTSRPEEAELAELVAAGRLFWSHGQCSTPEEQRRVTAAFYKDVAPHRKYRHHVLQYGPVGHWSYVATSAIAQSPIEVVGLPLRL